MDYQQIQEKIQDLIDTKMLEREDLNFQKINSATIQDQKVLIIKIEKKESEIDTCDEILKLLTFPQ